MASASSPAKEFITSLLRLTRFGNLLIIALAQYFTAGFLVGPYTLNDYLLFLLSCSTVFIAAGGYVINDYYDVKIDYINRPERVVIGKSITRRYAILFHVALSAIGVLVGMFISWRIGSVKIVVVNLFSVSCLWFYSNTLKRMPFVGNLTVAFLTGLSILIVDVLYRTGNSLITIYALFAFFMTLVREIIKDMEDLKGDNTFGCKTLPIVWGLRRTKFLIYFILLIFSATVATLNYFYNPLPEIYYIAFLFLPLLVLLYLLIRADMKKDFSVLSSFCKIILLLGIISMAFVGS